MPHWKTVAVSVAVTLLTMIAAANIESLRKYTGQNKPA